MMLISLGHILIYELSFLLSREYFEKKKELELKLQVSKVHFFYSTLKFYSIIILKLFNFFFFLWSSVIAKIIFGALRCLFPCGFSGLLFILSCPLAFVSIFSVGQSVCSLIFLVSF